MDAFDALRNTIRQMISISDSELDQFITRCVFRKCKKHEVLNYPGITPNEIFFINKGLIRVVIQDKEGKEHSIHFALENQFIADYSSFLLKQPSLYTLRTEEDTELVILPRTAVEWGYAHLKQGDRLGRLIAEYYFVYQDNRIQNIYSRTPKERYDAITAIFPNIHNRLPQHMIASYLGITPVHLSRLKKTDHLKT